MKRNKFFIIIIALILCSALINISPQKNKSEVNTSVTAEVGQLADIQSTSEEGTIPDLPVQEIEIDGSMRGIFYYGKANNTLINVTGVSCTIDVESNKICSVSQSGLAGYRFLHYEILKDNGNTSYILNVDASGKINNGDGYQLDSSFLFMDNYYGVHIVGFYMKVCDVSIVIPEECKPMGNYNIYIESKNDDGSVKLTQWYSDLTFDFNTVIIIEAAPNPFHKFSGFKRSQYFNSEVVKDNPNQLRVEVRMPREFSLSFDYQPVELKPNIKPSGSIITKDTVQISAEEVKLDDDIYISVKLNAIYEIKDFIINGIAVNHEDYTGNVEYSNNVAKIYVDRDWLAAYGGTLDIEITTKMNETFAIVGLSVLVGVPTLFLLILFLVLAGKGQKKAAHAVLKSKQAENYKRKTGDFISGIREGTITGEISSKDVKAEIKESKKEASEPIKPTDQPDIEKPE